MADRDTPLQRRLRRALGDRAGGPVADVITRATALDGLWWERSGDRFRTVAGRGTPNQVCIEWYPPRQLTLSPQPLAHDAPRPHPGAEPEVILHGAEARRLLDAIEGSLGRTGWRTFHDPGEARRMVEHMDYDRDVHRRLQTGDATVRRFPRMVS